MPQELLQMDGFPLEMDGVPLNIEKVFTGLKLTFNSIANVPVTEASVYDVDAWNVFFDLPAYGDPFTSVEVNNDDVWLKGASEIVLRPELFYLGENELGEPIYNTNILEIVDNNNCVFGINHIAFGSCSSLRKADMPLCTSIGDYCFADCASLPTADFPNCKDAGTGAFSYCSSLATVNLQLAEYIRPACFEYCISLTTIDISSVRPGMGGYYVGDEYISGYGEENGIFSGINGNIITLTIPGILVNQYFSNWDLDACTLCTNNSVTLITNTKYMPE